jgi:hypothetical protein
MLSINFCVHSNKKKNRTLSSMPKRPSRTSGKPYGIVIDPRESDLSVQEITSLLKTLINKQDSKGNIIDVTKLNLLLEQGPAIGVTGLNRSNAKALADRLQAHEIPAYPMNLGGKAPSEKPASSKDEVVLSWDTVGLPDDIKPSIKKKKSASESNLPTSSTLPDKQTDDVADIMRSLSSEGKKARRSSLEENGPPIKKTRTFIRAVFLSVLFLTGLFFFSKQLILDRSDERTTPLEEIQIFETPSPTTGSEEEGPDPLIVELNQRQRRAQALELFIDAQEFCQMGAISRCTDMTCQAAEIDPQLLVAERRCLDLLRSIEENSQELNPIDENRLQDTSDSVGSSHEASGSEQ